MRKTYHAEHSSCVTVVSNNHADVEQLRTKWKRDSAKDRAREIINHRMHARAEIPPCKKRDKETIHKKYRNHDLKTTKPRTTKRSSLRNNLKNKRRTIEK